MLSRLESSKLQLGTRHFRVGLGIPLAQLEEFLPSPNLAWSSILKLQEKSRLHFGLMQGVMKSPTLCSCFKCCSISGIFTKEWQRSHCWNFVGSFFLGLCLVTFARLALG